MSAADFLQHHVKSGAYCEPCDPDFMPVIHMPAQSLICMDGFKVSVQASSTHYCTPRNNNGPYTCFELGYPNQPDDLITEYAEDTDSLMNTVYAYVPINVVVELLNKHGGVDLRVVEIEHD